jgi:apolipoprotein D and lipocalin family protein
MNLSTVVIAGGVVCALAQVASAVTPLSTVDHVDLSRYTGTWYEIARYPNRFQRDCQSDTTAQYTRREDGTIQVVNSCRQAGGKMKVARGKAKVVDSKTNAKLKVTFFWPFYGDYWIIGLAPDYAYAIVGEPKRKYLWILSRTPQLDEHSFAEALQKVRAVGYDPEKLIKTPQSTPPK